MDKQYIYESYQKKGKGIILMVETIAAAGSGSVICFVPVTNTENQLKGLLSPRALITVRYKRGRKTGTVIETVNQTE